VFNLIYFRLDYYVSKIAVYSDCHHYLWISGQHQQQQSLQQLSQPQQSHEQKQHGGDENDESENLYANVEEAAESKPDIIYAQIVANNLDHDTVLASNMKNDNNAVIYSDLEGVGAGVHQQ